MDVPWLPPAERVTVRDPSSPAPGADAFRWFFYASNPPWNATRHSLSNVRALQKEFLVKLRNVFSFFTIYANIDGFDPAGDSGKVPVPIAKRPELDRWILSELAETVAGVTADLDAYDVYAATGKLTSFVDACPTGTCADRAIASGGRSPTGRSTRTRRLPTRRCTRRW